MPSNTQPAAGCGCDTCRTERAMARYKSEPAAPARDGAGPTTKNTSGQCFTNLENARGLPDGERTAPRHWRVGVAGCEVGCPACAAERTAPETETTEAIIAKWRAQGSTHAADMLELACAVEAGRAPEEAAVPTTDAKTGLRGLSITDRFACQHLSVRTASALGNSFPRRVLGERPTIGAVIDASDEDLLRIANIGPVAVAEVHRLRAAVEGTAAPTETEVQVGPHRFVRTEPWGWCRVNADGSFTKFAADAAWLDLIVAERTARISAESERDTAADNFDLMTRTWGEERAVSTRYWNALNRIAKDDGHRHGHRHYGEEPSSVIQRLQDIASAALEEVPRA